MKELLEILPIITGAVIALAANVLIELIRGYRDDIVVCPIG